MTDEPTDEVSTGSDSAEVPSPSETAGEYAAQTEPREEDPFKRMPGGRQTTEETYVDLHEHCNRLGRLARFDKAAPLLALGALLLGGAVGAWAVGEKITSTGILTCGCSGLALLLGGALLRDERVRSARDLHEDFEARLALYDDDPRVQAIKRRYHEREQSAREKRLASRLRRRLGLGESHPSAA